MDNFYTRTDWENSPSTKTPLNETNLNNIEDGVSELDDRVVELSHTKSSVDWVQLRKSGTKIAEVTIDGVKKDVFAPNGSGGGGGGTTDYEDLDNKPSINGVSLVGNKTNSDLGIIIPTTLAELEEDTTHRTVTDAQITKWNQGGSGGGGTAETTTYDNTTSGLDAENVQDAIDELSEDLTHKTMSGTSAEFDAIKDDSSIPNGSSFDITDDYEENKCKLLWENPNPSATFAPQNINLNSDKYDLLLFIYKYDNNSSECYSTTIPKGNNVRFDANIAISSGNYAVIRNRKLVCTNATQYSVEEAYSQNTNGARSTNNNALIPYKIYGIKL